MEPEIPEHVRPIKYRVSARVIKVKINKNLKFDTKVTWKRNQNRTETSTVTHSGMFSTFDETLFLDFTMYYDTNKGCFLDKNTELAVVIIMEGKVKAGGSNKFDLAEPLNKDFGNMNSGEVRKLALAKCPDPEAYIEVVFGYQLVQGSQVPAEMSVLNNSVQDLNMSKFEFTDEGKKSQIRKINETIDQMEQLRSKIAQKKLSKNTSSGPTPQVEMVLGQNKRLKQSVGKLEQKAVENELLWRNQKRDLEKQTHELQKMLDRKTKELNDKTREISTLNEKLKSSARNDDSTVANSQSSYEQMYHKMKEKYQLAMRQLEESKSKQIGSKEGLEHFQVKNHSFDLQFGKQFGLQAQPNQDDRLTQLEKQKLDLQNKLAEKSNQLGEIFNVAIEIGGAKLLDRLQSSIGLTEYSS